MTGAGSGFDSGSETTNITSILFIDGASYTSSSSTEASSLIVLLAPGFSFSFSWNTS